MVVASPAALRTRSAAAFVMAFLALLFMLRVWQAKPTYYDNFYYLADAWAHGRAWVSFPGDFLDVVPFHGRAYVVEAPLPAVLLFPFVVLYGHDANQTLLGNVLGAVAVYAAWRLCGNVGLGFVSTLAASLFLFFGTSLFVCATEGSVWCTSHASAVAFSLLALGECFGRRRAWLVGLWATCAALSRYPLFVMVPLYLVMLSARDLRRATIARYLAPIAPALAVWARYNYVRWKTLSDPGFSMFFRLMEPHPPGQAAFSLENMSVQGPALFFRPLHVLATRPWLEPRIFGFGIAYASAPFAYALLAPAGIDTLALWIGVAATLLPSLAYFDPGGMQFGGRHALDFEPFLFTLLLLALRRRPSTIVLIALVAFAAFGCYEASIYLFAPSLTP